MNFTKIKRLLLTAFLMCFSSVLYAVGLSNAIIKSYNSEPLYIEADIVGDGTVSLATPADYLQYNYEPLKYDLSIETVASGGVEKLYITTKHPIDEPSFTLLLRTKSESGAVGLLELPIILDFRPQEQVEKPVVEERKEEAPKEDEESQNETSQVAKTPQKEEKSTQSVEKKSEKAVTTEEKKVEAPKVEAPPKKVEKPQESQPQKSQERRSTQYYETSRTYGPVKAGETMWSIANAVKPANVSTQRMIDAIKQHNPQSFSRRGELLENSTLKIPDFNRPRQPEGSDDEVTEMSIGRPINVEPLQIEVIEAPKEVKPLTLSPSSGPKPLSIKPVEESSPKPLTIEPKKSEGVAEQQASVEPEPVMIQPPASERKDPVVEGREARIRQEEEALNASLVDTSGEGFLKENMFYLIGAGATIVLLLIALLLFKRRKDGRSIDEEVEKFKKGQPKEEIDFDLEAERAKKIEAEEARIAALVAKQQAEEEAKLAEERAKLEDPEDPLNSLDLEIPEELKVADKSVEEAQKPLKTAAPIKEEKQSAEEEEVSGLDFDLSGFTPQLATEVEEPKAEEPEAELDFGGLDFTLATDEVLQPPVESETQSSEESVEAVAPTLNFEAPALEVESLDNLEEIAPEVDFGVEKEEEDSAEVLDFQFDTVEEEEDDEPLPLSPELFGDAFANTPEPTEPQSIEIAEETANNSADLNLLLGDLNAPSLEVEESEAVEIEEVPQVEVPEIEIEEIEPLEIIEEPEIDTILEAPALEEITIEPEVVEVIEIPQEPAATEESPQPVVEGDDPYKSERVKLELAEAYLGFDPSLAKPLLEEVIAAGDKTLKAQAEEMMKKL